MNQIQDEESQMLPYPDDNYLQQVNKLFSLVISHDFSEAQKAAISLPSAWREQILSDVSSLIHSHKVKLIEMLGGERSILGNLTPTQQEDCVRTCTQLRADGGNLQEIAMSLTKLHPSLQISQRKIPELQQYATQIARGLDNVRLLQILPQIEEHEEYLKRFRNTPKESLIPLRQELENAFLHLRAGAGLDKATLEMFGRALAKAGFPSQTIADLKKFENHWRLLEVADKVHLAAWIVENNYGDQRAQEVELRRSLLDTLKPIELPNNKIYKL